MVNPGETDLLLAEANKLDVDVLCWGGTHRFDAYEYEGKFFVNPGSATGAMTTGWTLEGEEMVPSFCLMDVSLPLGKKRSMRVAAAATGSYYSSNNC